MTYYEAYGLDRARSLGRAPALHDPVWITDSELGAWTELRERVRVDSSEIDDHTYLMERVQLDYTSVGEFGTVTVDARLGPTNHRSSVRRHTTSPTGRARTTSATTTSRFSPGEPTSR